MNNQMTNNTTATQNRRFTMRFPKRFVLAIAAAVAGAALLPFLVTSSADAAVITGGRSVNTSVTCDATKHQLSISSTVVQDNGGNQSLSVEAWVLHNGQWRFLGRQEGTTDVDSLIGRTGSSIRFVYGTYDLSNVQGEFKVYLRYGWYTQAGWQYLYHYPIPSYTQYHPSYDHGWTPYYPSTCLV